jgi:hypothetical protein
MSDNTTTVTLEDVIADIITADGRTPYQFAKEVNQVLAKVGADKVLPPQMMYTYVSKGYIKAVDRVIDNDTAVEWATKYVTKYLTK